MDIQEMRKLLIELYEHNDEKLREDFDRSLPFADGLFSRWDKAQRLGFGVNTSIYNSSMIFGNVSVGNETWIGPNTLLDGSGGLLTIGDYCSISAGVMIFTHDTVEWAISGGALPKKTANVSIGSNCYIGSQAIIAQGVSVGRKSIVGANSFVNHEVPEGSIVAGSPAKLIGKVVGEGCDVQLSYD